MQVNLYAAFFFLHISVASHPRDFFAGCRHFVPALGFASSNPAGCTKLNIDLQEFMTFAGFLLYAAKYCKNTLIALEITAFLRHDYGRTQMLYKL